MFFFLTDNKPLPQEKDVKALRSRLSKLQESVDYCQDVMKFLNERNNFYVELHLLEKILEGYKKWMENAFKSPASNSQLDQCKNKIKSLKENEKKVLHIQEKSQSILSQHFPTIDISKVQSDTIKLNELWQSVLKSLTDKESELSKSLDTTPPTRYKKEMLYLNDKIDKLEGVLLTEHVIISDKKSLQLKLKNLKDIESGLTEANKAHTYVNSIGKTLFNRPGLDAQGERLRFELDNLNTRWTDIKVMLAEKITKLSKGIIFV